MEAISTDTEEDWKTNLKEGILPRTFTLTPELLIQMGVEPNAAALVLSQLREAHITRWKDLLTFRDKESLMSVVDVASVSKICAALDKYRTIRIWRSGAGMCLFPQSKEMKVLTQ